MTDMDEAVRRFADRLDQLSPAPSRIGIAVSGGPDSLALLLLTHAARPGMVEAATVDHGLRAESAGEANAIAALCQQLDIPHQILTVEWAETPDANIQAEARARRYTLLAEWAVARGLAAVATAHHADDQAETLLMRLSRGSGLSGLAGVRPIRALTDGVTLIRPLLEWRKAELVALVDSVGWTAVDDPANRDPRHDRSRVRAWLAGSELDAHRLARSASALGDVEDALTWTVQRLSDERIAAVEGGLSVDMNGVPIELRRRLLLVAMAKMDAPSPRGPDLIRALEALEKGGIVTLSGLKMRSGARWTLSREGPRRN